jgi:hypothetical protein
MVQHDGAPGAVPYCDHHRALTAAFPVRSRLLLTRCITFTHTRTWRVCHSPRRRGQPRLRRIDPNFFHLAGNRRIHTLCNYAQWVCMRPLDGPMPKGAMVLSLFPRIAVLTAVIGCVCIPVSAFSAPLVARAVSQAPVNLRATTS